MTRARPLVAALVAALVLLVPAAAVAAEPTGRIKHSQPVGDKLQLIFEADGLPDGVSVDQGSVRVRIDGKPVRSTITKYSSRQTGSRVAVLAIDNSQSMRSGGLVQAQAAARTFLDKVPPDVRVGLVVFGDQATVAVQPTKDRAEVRAAVDALQIDSNVGTALYAAAVLAAEATGSASSRSVLLLTDGADYGNTDTSLDQAVASIKAVGVEVDAVYTGTDATPEGLVTLVSDTGGRLTSDPTNPSAFFQSAASAISSQLSITAEVPPGTTGTVSVVVSATAGGTRIRADAVAPFKRPVPSSRPSPPAQTTSRELVLGRSALVVLLGALFLGLLVIVYIALSAIHKDDKHGRVRRRLSVYTLTGRAPVKQSETTALGSSQIARSAVELAGRVVQRRGFERDLALRLEGAGVPLRAAEWMIIHIGVAIGSAILLLLISGGGVAATLLGLVLGLGLPWAYLLVKESRRTSAFLAQLPDTLQLVAGSLSAGYSIPQAMDTVVREGLQPITGEFNRALVEARLGVPIEDAMEGIAERMKSRDFAWVVMAIRIQREVGGNLAELLTTVSNTLRERERLRRQIQVLSAEGRLSGWILVLLPPVFALYLALVRPSYLRPLVSELLGWVMLGGAGALLLIGALWMRKTVKVEV